MAKRAGVDQGEQVDIDVSGWKPDRSASEYTGGTGRGPL